MRPIFITALTLMAGAAAILNDPIFEGMAVSLLFGTAVATVLTLVVIPLGCISARRHFYLLTCTTPPEEDLEEAGAKQPGKPLWLKFWTILSTTLMWTFYILRALLTIIMTLIQKLRSRKKSPAADKPAPDNTTPASPALTPTPVSASPGDSGAVKTSSSSREQQTPDTSKTEVLAEEKVDSKVKTRATTSVKTKKTGSKKPAVKKSTPAKTTAKKTAAKPVQVKAAVKKTSTAKKTVAKKNKATSKTTTKKSVQVKKPVAGNTDKSSSTASSTKKSTAGKGKGKTRRGIRLKKDLD